MYSVLNDRFSKLATEVGAWSHSNFHFQESKTESIPLMRTEATMHEKQLHQHIILNSVAPFLGIVEEFGEQELAIAQQDLGLVKDGVGDMLIFMADFYYRSKLPIVLRWDKIEDKLKIEAPVSEHGGTAQYILMTIGRACHAVLKHHQGIRGYERAEKYVPEINHIMEDLVVGLGRKLYCAKRDYCRGLYSSTGIRKVDDELAYCAVDASEIMGLAETVWVTVKERNWKKNSTSGA